VTRTALAVASPGPLGPKLDSIERAVRTSTDIREVQAHRAGLDAIAKLLRLQQARHDEQNDVAYLKLVAERRLGALLIEMEERGERRSRIANLRRGPNCHDASSGPPGLDDLHIDSNDSSRWQREARVPEMAFEAWAVRHRSGSNEITRAGLLALERELREKPPPPWKPWEQTDPLDPARFDAAEQAREVLERAQRFLAAQPAGTARAQMACEKLREFDRVLHAGLTALLDNVPGDEGA
jgi:hypothetical protein